MALAKYFNLGQLLGKFSQDIGIDLGTANSVVCTRQEGIILIEPSVVAVKKGTNEVLMNGDAVGNAAKKMLDKVPGGVEAIRPLKHGVITSMEITEAMVAYFIRKATSRTWGIKPRLIVSIPMGINNMQKRSVVESCERAGAREVYLIEQPMAAALGAGLPINEPSGSMIVDIGGGTTDVAVISLAGVVMYRTLPVAGDDLNDAIVEHMKRHYNLLVGEQTAERIKITIGSVAPLGEIGQEEMRMEVRGRSTITQLPDRTEITSMEIRNCLGPVADKIIQAIKDVLRETPPELSADLVERGIKLAGGGAYLRGLDWLIEREVNMPCHVADEPLYAVAKGTAAVMQDFEELKEVLQSGADI